MKKFVLLIGFIVALCQLQAQNNTSTYRSSSTASDVISYNTVEQKPLFNGAATASDNYKTLQDYLSTFQEKYRKDGSTSIPVRFVIDKKGRCKVESLMLDANDPLYKVIVETIESMPAWKPGENKGKVVEVLYTLNFVI